MKNLFVLLFVIGIVTLTGCEKTQEEKNLEQIENQIKQSMNDPKSFEFVSFELVSTLTFEDNYNKILNRLSKDLVFETNLLSTYSVSLINLENYIDEYNINNKKYPSIYTKKDFSNDLKEKTESIETQKTKVTQKENEINYYKTEFEKLDPKEVVFYNYVYKFRGKNILGGLVLSEVIVQLDKDKNIVNVTSEIDDMKVWDWTFNGKVKDFE